MRETARRIEHLFLTAELFERIHYKRTYKASSLCLMFFTFSFFGWIWEVCLHIIEDGMIINRGVLSGPWLPIYGFGGVLVLLLFHKLRERPVTLFGAIVILCGVMEYAVSLALESLFGVRWWDYSDMLVHIEGRVCLEGLLIFGIGGLFIVYIAAPRLDDFFMKHTLAARRFLCTLLILLFAANTFVSFISPNMGFGITY